MWLNAMKKILTLTLLSAFLLILPLKAVLADNETVYDLSWWSVDNGGSCSSDAQYTLHSVIGQADTSQSFNSQYTLTGGFLSFGAQARQFLQIILPFIFKDSSISAEP
jgi:hypothetical protein